MFYFSTQGQQRKRHLTRLNDSWKTMLVRYVYLVRALLRLQHEQSIHMLLCYDIEHELPVGNLRLSLTSHGEIDVHGRRWQNIPKYELCNSLPNHCGIRL